MGPLAARRKHNRNVTIAKGQERISDQALGDRLGGFSSWTQGPPSS